MSVTTIVLVIINFILVVTCLLFASGALSFIGIDITISEVWGVFWRMWLWVHYFCLPMAGVCVWLVNKMCKT